MAWRQNVTMRACPFSKGDLEQFRPWWREMSPAHESMCYSKKAQIQTRFDTRARSRIDQQWHLVIFTYLAF